MIDSNNTVVIPFFNEENTLEAAVKNLIKENISREIILVDDGSNDKSNEIASSLATEYKFIKLIESKENKGKGHALKKGINVSSKKFIGVLDADLEYSPKDLKKLFIEINKNNLDIICGSRFIGDDKRENLYVRTYLANRFLSIFFSIIHKQKVTDIATCLKVFRKDLLQSIELKANGFSIEVEILAKTLKKSDNFAELPISYTARSYKEGKKIKLIDGFKYMYSIIKFKL